MIVPFWYCLVEGTILEKIADKITKNKYKNIPFKKRYTPKE